MRVRFGFALGALVATLTCTSLAVAQVAPASTSPQIPIALHPELLPTAFGDWKVTDAGGSGSTGIGSTGIGQPAFLAQANQSALEECEPARSVQRLYAHGNGAPALGVTAIELKDVSGALAAFSILSQPGMHEVSDLGSAAVAGDGAVLFLTGAVVAVAYPAGVADVPALKALALVMPKPVGSQALRPLLPSLLPTRGLTPGTLRYALGQQGYMASGGVLPAAGLGWEQSAEAVTAKYNDRRGAETLTLLLYPTPTIAASHLRQVEALLPGLGPSFAKAKARREGSLVVVADGTFSADAAQALVENTHLRQIATTDRAMPTPEVIETRKTFGTLADIIVFSGLLCGAALVLGLFLGGGRALVRILQGKPAATEAEFLSLHLQPQNAAPQFSVGKPGDPA